VVRVEGTSPFDQRLDQPVDLISYIVIDLVMGIFRVGIESCTICKQCNIGHQLM
jgi:hypothetical protein